MLRSQYCVRLNFNIQGNPDFSNLQGRRKLVREVEEFDKSGVKLQCLTKGRERLLVRVIGRLEKMRVREIRIIGLFCYIPIL